MMLIFIKIFAVFWLCRCDVFAKVDFIEVPNTNKIANFIGELLNDNSLKEFSRIQDVTVVKLSMEWDHSDLFYDVLNSTIKTNPVLLSTFINDFNIQRARVPTFVIIFFNLEVSVFILQLNI